LVSTFSGKANKLGEDDLSSGWQEALKALVACGNPPLNALHPCMVKLINNTVYCRESKHGTATSRIWLNFRKHG
jgi:hypothetical protein